MFKITISYVSCQPEFTNIPTTVIKMKNQNEYTPFSHFTLSCTFSIKAISITQINHPPPSSLCQQYIKEADNTSILSTHQHSLHQIWRWGRRPWHPAEHQARPGCHGDEGHDGTSAQQPSPWLERHGNFRVNKNMCWSWLASNPYINLRLVKVTWSRFK